MDKAHEIQIEAFSGTFLRLKVDGNCYEIDLAEQSARLARAPQEQREKVEISPTGYGLHWPGLDEDLSIDGLIGVKHTFQLSHEEASGSQNKQMHADR